jgi:hypothetical protein
MIHSFADITGIPALLIILLLFYLFVYTPIKLVVKVIAHGSKKAERIRLLQQQTVIAEYDSPAGLTPAEIGFLFDTKINITEIFATIVSLQQRGLVTIEDEDKLKVIEVKNAPNDIKPFDKYVLNALKNGTKVNKKINIGEAITMDKAFTIESRNDGDKIINKRFLKNVRWGSELILRQELQSQGYIKTTKEQVRSVGVRLGFIMVVIVWVLPLWAFHPKNFADALALMAFFTFFAPFFLIVAIFLLLNYQKIAGEPWLGTPKLKEIWPDIEGYRQFIEQVEADRLKFESENTKGTVKNKTLPYAIALGFNTGWKKKI